jgi:SAM-dependent methyltransferase
MLNAMHNAAQINSRVWRTLYATGRNDLQYPNDVLVRLSARLFNRARDRRILDFGFGTGANLLHVAGQGYEVYGVEISEHALARTRQRLEAAGLGAELRLIGAEDPLPFEDGHFDVIYAWQVLYYSDLQTWQRKVKEMERVTKRGGLILVATAAPGDVSQLEAEPLGDSVYRSIVSEQEGCILTIPEREALADFFPGRQIEIGEFGFKYGATRTRHWIISYRMPNQ